MRLLASPALLLLQQRRPVFFCWRSCFYSTLAYFMKLPDSNTPASFEDKFFLSLLLVVSVAFLWLLSPFYGAVFWAAVMAILFYSVFARLHKAMPARNNSAALLTVLLILLLVILPLSLVGALLVQEASLVFGRLQTEEVSFTRYVQQVYAVLPDWALGLLSRFGLSDIAVVQEKLASNLTKASQFLATQALSVGQNTFEFVASFFIMVYLLFFFLRDGAALVGRMNQQLPLHAHIKHNLAEKFTTVIRATVKGNIAVAMMQGALGGLIFWLLDIHAPVLWGTVMVFLSLVPAVGAALVWLPVAVYFLLTGEVWQGAVLTAFGVLVIGLVDNVMRPLLVGKDTKMPDYVVLLSTIGGMALFGLNGFVIGPVIAAMFMAAWDLFAISRDGAALQSADSPASPADSN
jgi:predicted PurR-regulated permease PerM